MRFAREKRVGREEERSRAETCGTRIAAAAWTRTNRQKEVSLSETSSRCVSLTRRKFLQQNVYCTVVVTEKYIDIL